MHNVPVLKSLPSNESVEYYETAIDLIFLVVRNQILENFFWNHLNTYREYVKECIKRDKNIETRVG